MKRTNFVMMFLAITACALPMHAQTLLDSLHPRPRQAYVRLPISGVFGVHQSMKLYLDPAAPLHGAAAAINARLRALVLPELEIAMWTDADTLAPGVFLGMGTGQLNRMLAAVLDQRVQVNSLYPGPEGYVLDVMPTRAIIAGSDSAGVYYGADTFLQLLEASPTRWLHACRIVDVPEFPVRWLYYSTNVQVGANVTKAKQVWSSALEQRLNGVHLSDSKFGRPTTLPGFYFDSLRALLQWAADRRFAVIPGVMPFGYSESILYHDPNLAAGLPVVRQRFYSDDDTAYVLSRIPPMPNGDFEWLSGSDAIPGFTFIDQPAKISFVDLAVRHGGKASVRFENFTAHDPQHGHGRIALRRKVTPFTQYRLSGWVRTEGLQPANCIVMAAIGNRNPSLLFTDIALPSTTGNWRFLDYTLNSLDSDTLTVYWGVWGARDGKIWWDDLGFDECAFVNLIRRNGAPLLVEDKAGTRMYIEGTDFDTLRDASMGRNPWPGAYDTYHTPPRMLLRTMPHDTFHVSYHHATVIYSGQVMMTMSEPAVYDILDREFRALDTVMRAGSYFMQHDEIRTMNWDEGDRRRGLTPARILADNVSRCRDIIRRANPTAALWIWSDMFDEYHNAVKRNYYLVNGDLTGSADLLPKDIGIVNWNGRDGIVQRSLDFFAARGFRQISAPFYDGDVNDIRLWKERTRDVPDFHGMMYTTWSSDYSYLKPFGAYAWNHAPYIEHFPPWVLPPNGQLDLPVTISGDTWDVGWSASAAAVRYRTAPGVPFTALPFAPDPGTARSVTLQLPAGTPWVQWYVEASDNRGWSTKVPFGDSVYYELGALPTGAAVQPDAPALLVFGCYPSPIKADGILSVDMRVTEGNPVSVTVTDLLGRIAYHSEAEGMGRLQTLRLTASGWAPGVYSITVRSGSEMRVLRVVR